MYKMHLLVNGLLISSPDQYMNEWLHFVKEPLLDKQSLIEIIWKSIAKCNEAWKISKCMYRMHLIDNVYQIGLLENSCKNNNCSWIYNVGITKNWPIDTFFKRSIYYACNWRNQRMWVHFVHNMLKKNFWLIVYNLF